MNTRSSLNRRQLLLAIGVLAAPSSHASLFDGVREKLGLVAEPATLRIALIDTSRSRTESDSELYGKAVAQQLERIANGDRVVVARLGEAGLGRFSASADVTIEKTNRYYADEAARKTAGKELQASVDRLIKSPATDGKTCIVETLMALEKICRDAHGKGQRCELLVCSDGLESSAIADFEALAWKDPAAEASRLFAAVRKGGLVAQLSGTQAYFVGGAGRSFRMVQGARQFWEQYWHAAGGALRHYARTLPSFQ